MQGVQDLLGGELHDLSIEVDDPNHLFLFLQHPLTDVDQSLIGVSAELIVIEHFMQLVDLNIADPSNLSRDQPGTGNGRSESGSCYSQRCHN